VPVLEVGGVVYCQSNAILRYVGKLAKLYPEDPVLALRADMVKRERKRERVRVFAPLTFYCLQ
jgi:glutathione S-transferase